MTTTAHDIDVAQLRQTRVASVLHQLGDDLLTAEELAEVNRLTALANTAEDAARAFEQQRAGLARQAAAELVEAGTVATDALIAAAQELAPVDDVQLVARNVYSVAATKARAITFRRIGNAPQMLNDRLDGIVAEVEKLAPKLANVPTAQKAIETGKTKEWQHVSELQVQFKSLSEVVSELRYSGQLPKAINSRQQGGHWSFRRPVSPFAFKQAQEVNDDGRAAFLLDIKRRPWVPASVADAEKVRKDWENGNTPEVAA